MRQVVERQATIVNTYTGRKAAPQLDMADLDAVWQGRKTVRLKPPETGFFVLANAAANRPSKRLGQPAPGSAQMFAPEFIEPLSVHLLASVKRFGLVTCSAAGREGAPHLTTSADQ